MQSTTHSPKFENLQEQKSLHAIVKKILTTLTGPAAQRSSVIINDISPSFVVEADEHTLSSLLGIILGKIIMDGKDSCYRLSARQYSNTVLFNIKDTGSFTEYQNNFYSEETHELCQTLGGCISMNEFHHHATSLTFSFRNEASFS